jgi:hypothetical protein
VAHAKGESFVLLKSRFLPIAGSLAVICTFTGLQSSEPAPKVSTFAPADDLAGQVDQYIEALKKSTADEEEYGLDKDKIARDANTLVVVALSLGMHDQPNKYKASAAALLKAAGQAAAAKDYACVKKAVAAVESAAAGNGPAEGQLRWEKVAALPELMKEVPLINTRLKRYVKGAKFRSKARETAGYTAVIAAIAQGTMADTSEAKKPGQVEQWREFMAAMRDAAGAVNGAIHRGDKAAADKSMKELVQSCEQCHAVFHPEAKIE